MSLPLLRQRILRATASSVVTSLGTKGKASVEHGDPALLLYALPSATPLPSFPPLNPHSRAFGGPLVMSPPLELDSLAPTATPSLLHSCTTATPSLLHSCTTATPSLFAPMVARIEQQRLLLGPCPRLRHDMSTFVGQGSGGRAEGPPLHEPPETHPFSVKGLNHIALAVPDLSAASEHYRTVFGAQVSDPHPLPQHGVTVVFVHVGSTTLELLEPLGDNSPIKKFLEKNPRGGIHHLCFTVDNIEVASQHLLEEGVQVLGDYAHSGESDGKTAVATPQFGAHGNPVIFLNPRDNLGVLCELEQVFCRERI